jgi:hypothetical protein
MIFRASLSAPEIRSAAIPKGWSRDSANLDDLPKIVVIRHGA